MVICWDGNGIEDVGVDESGATRIRIDPEYFRPTEVETLLGDASKAHRELGWEPRTSFEELVKEMSASDLELARAEMRNLNGTTSIRGRFD